MVSKQIFVSLADKNTKSESIFIQLLKEYQKLVHSCIGPNGRVKLLAREINNSSTDLTSSSKILSSILFDIKNVQNYDSKTEFDTKQFCFIEWKFELIKSIITNGHLDHDYDSGLFLIHLTNEFLLQSSRFSLTHLNEKNVINQLLKSLHEHLNDSKHDKNSLIAVKLDLSNISFFKRIIGTLLNSKCLVEQLEKSKKERFINLCLQAFINSFQVDALDSEYFSPILYLYNDDFSSHLEDSKLFSGVLFQIDDTQRFKDFKNQYDNLKCVFFDASFSGDFEDLTNCGYSVEISSQAINHNRTVLLMTEKLKKICELLIRNFDVKVILCQKVIHPSVKTFLNQKNILFVDRLSNQLKKAVIKLTGCKVCNSSWSLEQFNKDSFGNLSSLNLKNHMNRNYIHLENNNVPISVQTMVICVQNESMLMEIQNLIQVAEKTFQRTILNGTGFCGGACFYSYSMCYLWKFIYQEFNSCFKDSNEDKYRQININKAKVFELMKTVQIIFTNFFKCLLEKGLSNYFLDISSGHLFLNGKRCNCGLLNQSDSVTAWVNLYEEINYNEINFELMLKHQISERCNAEKAILLIDCFESKLNCLKMVREILGSILQVGVFIHD